MQGFLRQFDAQKILTDDQVEQIHQATLQILRETGVAVNDERALKIFEENGCFVDKENNRVRIPEYLVEDMLEKCPSTFRIRARDPKNDIILQGDGNRSYFAGGLGNQIVDIDTWETRDPTRKEFYNQIKLFDALPNTHILPAFPYFGFQKVPQILRLIESQACKVRASTKASIEGGIMGNDRWNIELAKAVGADVSILCNPSPPLSYGESTVDDVLRAADANMPFWFSTGPVAGATGPATIAGLVACCNAENMAGMILGQLYKPGSRIWTGSFLFVQDMITGGPKFGAVENMLAESIFHQVWRRYKIPAYASTGGWTASKMIDYQAGAEQGMGVLNAAQAGASVLFFQGGLTGELSASPVKAVLDDEIAGQIGRYLEGVNVSTDTLAVDLVNEVGPIPGEFLTTQHTRDWWKKEQVMRPVADTLPYAQWMKAGKKSALDHARQKMEEILTTHRIKPLPPEQEQAVEDILNDARQWYRKQGMISDEEWKVYQEDLNSPNYPFE